MGLDTESYILALDVGTTAITSILMDQDGKIISRASRGVALSHPEPHWVEQNPDHLWNAALDSMTMALKEAEAKWTHVAAIGIANQRETVVMWDNETSEPLKSAISWQCQRTRQRCYELVQNDYGYWIFQRTGLTIDPYFSGSKIQWMLEHEPKAKALHKQKRLNIGTVDSWMLWKLSGGKLFMTDYSNASRTMLFNIHDRHWDSDLLNLFGTPEECLPQVIASSLCVGTSDPMVTDGKPVFLASMAGDQQAALFGHQCWEPGTIKCTLGTGAFILMNGGHELHDNLTQGNKHGLLLTLTPGIHHPVDYALEGSIFSAGATMGWLCQGLSIAPDGMALEELAASVPDSGGVFLFPSFQGLGSPHWKNDIHGACLQGLSYGSTPAHIARAAYEATAFRIREVVQAMANAMPKFEQNSLRVDGGLSRSDFLMQLLANTLNKNVVRPQEVEMTALGAAYLAGLAVEFWESPEEVSEIAPPTKTFSPQHHRATVETQFQLWSTQLERYLKSLPN